MDQGRRPGSRKAQPFTPPEALEWHRARVFDAARLLDRSRTRDPALVEAVCARVRELDREIEAQRRATTPGPKSWANQFTSQREQSK